MREGERGRYEGSDMGEKVEGRREDMKEEGEGKI